MFRRTCNAWMLLLLCSSLPMAASDSAPADSPLIDSALYPLDTLQKKATRVVRRFSSNVDSRLSQAFDDENVTEGAGEEDDFTLMDYFTDESAFDSENHSYARLVVGYEFDKLGKNSQILDMTAQIILPKTRERLRIFIGDETKETGDLTSLDTETERAGIGLDYYFDHFFNIFHPSVAIGFAGFNNPYAKLKMHRSFGNETWLFHPSQVLRYSAEKAFEEWTDLVFAYRIRSNRLLRLLLRRSTEEDVEGMGYLAQLSYYKPSFHRTGLKSYVGLYGRTEALSEPYANGTPAEPGVYNYTAGVIWKDSFLRDYLFYQVHPAVEYHEQYDYHPNYILRLTVEFFIGEKAGRN